jgi:hypothetical protein
MSVSSLAAESKPAAILRRGYALAPGGWRLTAGALEALAATAVDIVARLQRNFAAALSGAEAGLLSELLEWPDGVGALEAWGGAPDTSLGCHRCDAVFSDGRWQVLEVNSMNAGGWILPSLYASELGLPGDGGRPPDPAFRLFAHLIAAREKMGLDGSARAGRIVLIRERESAEYDEAFLDHCRHAARAAAPGWEVAYGRWDELEFGREAVSAPSGPVGIIVELEVAPTLRRLQAQLLASRGGLLLVAGPVSRLVNDKRWLARLSAQTAAVAPTRLVSSRPNSRSAPACAPAEAIEARENLVLKKALSDGGGDVFVGRRNGVQAWRDLVKTAAVEGDWVAQQWIAPERPPGAAWNEPLPADSHLIFCPFVVAGRYAGGFVRVLDPHGYEAAGPIDGGGPLSMARSRNSDRHVPVFPILSAPGETAEL